MRCALFCVVLLPALICWGGSAVFGDIISVDRSNGYSAPNQTYWPGSNSETDPVFVNGGVTDGAAAYVDRPNSVLNYANVPAILEGADYVRTCIDDHAGGPNTNYAVTIDTTSKLYVTLWSFLKSGVYPLDWMVDGSGPVFSNTGETITFRYNGGQASWVGEVWATGPVPAGTYNFEDQDRNYYVETNFYGIAAVAVPEPSTGVLGAMTIAGCILARRCRKERRRLS